MTYRVGTHHGVTIVDESNARCGRPGHDCARGHLAATAQTQEYAELICDALNGSDDYRAEAFEAVGLLGLVRQLRLDGEDDTLTWAQFDECWQDFSRRRQEGESFRTPDVDHTNGAREALALIAERIANAADDFDTDVLKTLRIILESAAAELGVDEEAPGSPLRAPVAAQDGPVGGSGRPDGAEAISAAPRRRQHASAITWICNRCNRELSGNPRLCPHCGYTVYRPKSPAAERKADQA